MFRLQGTIHDSLSPNMMFMITSKLAALTFLFSSIVLHLILQTHVSLAIAQSNLAKAQGTKFVVNGKHLYINGFNAYWLMVTASYPSGAKHVTSTFQQAAKLGMTVARTWAFGDGGYRPLQAKRGSYVEDVFKGLDFVVSEAKNNNLYLILSLVNNYPDYGGRRQYVQWAKEEGVPLKSDDDFYTSSVVRGYYKNHIKAILTRINNYTGLAYKDDPTIFAWELINEPHCESDLSGKMFQDWLIEMAAYVKSIDSNHMLEVGLEGFYGETKKQSNPNSYLLGTDFISNNQVEHVDFATIHAYPDQWLSTLTDDEQISFLKQWIDNHVQDSAELIKKPLLLAEFGKSIMNTSHSTGKRDEVFSTAYDMIYASAKGGGPLSGGLFWQLLDEGMDLMRDGYEVVVVESATTSDIIAQQSHKLVNLTF